MGAPAPGSDGRGDRSPRRPVLRAHEAGVLRRDQPVLQPLACSPATPARGVDLGPRRHVAWPVAAPTVPVRARRNLAAGGGILSRLLPAAGAAFHVQDP